MSKQLALLLISFLLTNQISAFNTNTAEINWGLILLNTPLGLAERVKFAQCYITALENRNLQSASFLLDRACQQIDHVKSGTSLADIKVAVHQIDHICHKHGHADAECYACTKSTAKSITAAPAILLPYSTEYWQAMPQPCLAHFSDLELQATIDMLKITAFTIRKASAITQLDSVMVSHKVTAACDYRVLRFLKIHILAQKHVTPDNITWLQSKILDKLCTVYKPVSPSAKPADLVDRDHDLCKTEWTILLA